MTHNRIATAADFEQWYNDLTTDENFELDVKLDDRGEVVQRWRFTRNLKASDQLNMAIGVYASGVKAEDVQAALNKRRLIEEAKAKKEGREPEEVTLTQEDWEGISVTDPTVLMIATIIAASVSPRFTQDHYSQLEKLPIGTLKEVSEAIALEIGSLSKQGVAAQKATFPEVPDQEVQPEAGPGVGDDGAGDAPADDVA